MIIISKGDKMTSEKKLNPKYKKALLGRRWLWGRLTSIVREEIF
jgi:hypothetical protein